MTGTWQCLLSPALAGQPWAALCQCPPFIQAGLAALVPGAMLLVLKSGSREQPAELLLNPVLRVALHPCSLETHGATWLFPPSWLWSWGDRGGWGFAGVQQLL